MRDLGLGVFQSSQYYFMGILDKFEKFWGGRRNAWRCRKKQP